MQIVELLTPAYEAAWLPWAVQYFFFIGIAATSALTVAGLTLFARNSRAASMLMPAAVVVLAISVIAAPVSLLADLHQPGRFWHFYAHFTPWSWMSIGAYLLPVFVFLSLALCAAWWFGKTGWLRLFAVLISFSAISILAYTGLEVMVVRSRPLWNTPFLPINFALTGWMSALGAMLLIVRWLPGGLGKESAELLRRLGLVALGLAFASAIVWTIMGALGHDASFTMAKKLYEQFPVWKLSVVGSVLTAAFILGLLLRHSRFLMRPHYSMLVAAALMASAWVFRWIIFMAVQGVPKYGAGLYLYHMPIGGDGLLGILGMFGLCVTIIAAILFLLEKFPKYAVRSQSS
ncbi:polysulfide reductase NrfD [Orrella sp. NBD-18]|uniref:Polysulfide reductase NrfD n=1 Tax=Sheuella amnicola TaxID=2707330 RepID=A0A6B2QWH2_9BURK|nr:NrfD/PsrC family molybdoenzyme membrane anchor subunit [Sheuella amnicola]NDY81604.1 polysulfide reductase NrfD [Sheuella amnicola]HBI82866.1 tetrathionate reductase [Alcaligenaceae bacterium]